MKNSSEYFTQNKTAYKKLYLIGALLFLISAALGLLLGSSTLAFRSGSLLHASEMQKHIFFYVRLPRTAASLLCGAALAVSGAVIQNVLQNRLASPGIIGVNAGAGFAVTLLGAFGIYGGFILSVAAFLGAFLSVMLVTLGAQKWHSSRGTVILLGVSVGSLFGAASDTVTAFFPDVAVMRSAFKIGEFASVNFKNLLPAIPLVIVVISVLLFFHNDLDIFSLGEESAKGLGANVSLMRTFFLLASALLAGCAVSIAGLLSFVGLIVPHAVRRLCHGRALHLISLSALFGASFVSLCDTAARTVFTPYEIPVGIIMSFLGVPFFIHILIKDKGGHKHASS